MSPQDLKHALEIVKTAVVEVSEPLRANFGKVEHTTKFDTGDSASDVVTELDKQTEHFLAEQLAKFDSSIAFRGEEFGVRSEANTTWLVDPIDGTAHFIRGMPFCTTMVALIEDDQVVLSVIYDFIRQDKYWAIKGQGAHCNEERIQVSQRDLRSGLLSYETNLSKPDNLKRYMAARAQTVFMQTINCGFEFAMVASGRLDGRIAVDGYGFDWDYAPGSLLVAEAGGVVRNVGKDTYDYRDHNLLAVNPVIYKQLTSGDEATFPLQA